MNYFDRFVSNTLAGSANQSFFYGDCEKVTTGRVFYKLYKGGKFNYSLLFTNIIDSTFQDGLHSHRNLVCDEWEMVSLKVGVTKDATPENCESLTDVTFDGKKSKSVMPGEFFATDEFEISAEKGDYLCVEIDFKGKMIPYHYEINIPTFIKNSDGWVRSAKMPVSSMVGCERNPKLKVGFLGDSITQGIGTEMGSYDHWNARLADMIGADYSYWNLGIGFARANDAATDGAWLFKAKQMDAVAVCFGVNDILHAHSAEQVKEDLKIIVNKLHDAGCRVLVQTVPPFDMNEEEEKTRMEVSRFILNELKADAVFDNNPILADKNRAIYGGHPDAEGCRKWAEALCPVMKEFLFGK